MVKNEITSDDYRNCLGNKVKQYRTKNLICSYKYESYTVENIKIVLSGGVDKRYILANRINTLPWGNFSIKS